MHNARYIPDFIPAGTSHENTLSIRPSRRIALALGLARPAALFFKEALGGEKARFRLRRIFRRECRPDLPLEQIEADSEKNSAAGHHARSACETVFLVKCRLE